MERETIRSSIESLLTTLLEVDQVQGCLVEDDRSDTIAAVGVVRLPDALSIEVRLGLGGRLVVWFRERPGIGVVRTYARRIERELTELVVAYERSLVRP